MPKLTVAYGGWCISPPPPLLNAAATVYNRICVHYLTGTRVDGLIDCFGFHGCICVRTTNAVTSPKWPTVRAITRLAPSESTHSLADRDVISPSGQGFTMRRLFQLSFSLKHQDCKSMTKFVCKVFAKFSVTSETGCDIKTSLGLGLCKLMARIQL